MHEPHPQGLPTTSLTHLVRLLLVAERVGHHAGGCQSGGSDSYEAGVVEKNTWVKHTGNYLVSGYALLRTVVPDHHMSQILACDGDSLQCAPCHWSKNDRFLLAMIHAPGATSHLFCRQQASHKRSIQSLLAGSGPT
jgi:hypothetical protein